MSIGTLIKAIQDIMRKDVGVDGDAQQISQIVWLLFLKIFDDKEQEWLLTIQGYKSPLPNRFRWSAWARNPEGYKSYSRSKPLTIQEFDLEKKWWNRRKTTEYAWKMSAREIAARNYNLDCKNPHEAVVNHRDPEVLMQEYLEIARQLAAAQTALKQELMQALGGGGNGK
jgi:type I restriction-modification system DNA methylase subunit